MSTEDLPVLSPSEGRATSCLGILLPTHSQTLGQPTRAPSPAPAQGFWKPLQGCAGAAFLLTRQSPQTRIPRKRKEWQKWDTKIFRAPQ